MALPFRGIQTLIRSESWHIIATNVRIFSSVIPISLIAARANHTPNTDWCLASHSFKFSLTSRQERYESVKWTCVCLRQISTTLLSLDLLHVHSSSHAKNLRQVVPTRHSCGTDPSFCALPGDDNRGARCFRLWIPKDQLYTRKGFASAGSLTGYMGLDNVHDQSLACKNKSKQEAH